MMKAITVTTQAELEQTFALRKEVFVDEQKVPLEDEFDAFDTLVADCAHVLVVDGEVPVGCGRLRVVDGVGKLERIVTKKLMRKSGVGREVVRALETLAKERGLEQVKLHGQTQAEQFYQKLGYHTASDIFMEDGIEHVVMMKKVVD